MARRSEHSRDEIKAMAITAATSILSRDGMQALSTRHVAKEIGYTVGTLYLVFKNLDELILHINTATLTELEQQLSAQATAVHFPQDKIKVIAQGYLQYAQTNPTRWSLLFSHQLPHGAPVPNWFIEKVSTMFELIEVPLRLLKPDREATVYRAAARALWGGVQGICTLAMSDKLRWGADVATEDVINSLVGNYLIGFLQGLEDKHAEVSL